MGSQQQALELVSIIQSPNRKEFVAIPKSLSLKIPIQQKSIISLANREYQSSQVCIRKLQKKKTLNGSL
jgi:hypothetical protein